MNEELLAQLLALAKADPSDVDLAFMLATQLQAAGRYEEAIEKARNYVAKGSDPAAGYRVLALASHALGRRDEAITAAREGLEKARAKGHPQLIAELEELLDTFTAG